MDVVALSNRQSSDLPFRRKTTTYTLQQQTPACVVMEAEQVDGCNFIGVCAFVRVCVCRRTLPQAKVIEQLRSSCYTPG